MVEHKSASIKSTNINELSITDLEFLDTSNGHENPKCNFIYCCHDYIFFVKGKCYRCKSKISKKF